MRTALFRVALSMIGLLPSAAGATNFAAIPASLQLRPGQVGYLDLGDGVNPLVYVCPIEYVLDPTRDIKRCPTIPYGTRIRVLSVRKVLSGLHITAVEVQGIHGGHTGWVRSIDIRPILPAGAEYVLLKENGIAASVLRERTGALSQHEIVLGDRTQVRLLKQIPPSAGNCNVYIEILTGPHKGERVWTFENELRFANGWPAGALYDDGWSELN